jgi:hypothetical protein
MKKIIILRGHQGSGKSTYAKELFNKFKAEYNNALIYEVSYDDILVKENGGEYIWTPENITNAMNIAWNEYREFVKAHGSRDENILVVHSATNKTLKAFKSYIDYAKKRGYKVEVIRLTSFFDNTHNCSAKIVADAFIKIDQNPIKDEIILPCQKGPSDEILAEIELYKRANELVKNEATNSYVNINYIFANSNKIKSRRSDQYPELSTYKYANKVFYNNEFDDALLELRGLVLDDEGNIIVRPFNKAFNLCEREAKNSKYPIKLDANDHFNAILKINGFLGCATYVSKDEFEGKSFNNKVLFSTTGSLDSSFVQMAKEHLEKYQNLFVAKPNYTFLFEIVDEKDPHIIEEELGEYLLACRDVLTGELVNQDELRHFVGEISKSDDILKQIKFPQIFHNIAFKEIQKIGFSAMHEGFVVYDLDFKEIVFKLKTPFYLITKFIGRKKDLNKMLMGLKDHKVDGNFIQKYSIDEEFFPLIEHLSKNIDEVLVLGEQGRIAYIRNFLIKFYKEI